MERQALSCSFSAVKSPVLMDSRQNAERPGASPADPVTASDDSAESVLRGILASGGALLLAALALWALLPQLDAGHGAAVSGTAASRVFAGSDFRAERGDGAYIDGNTQIIGQLTGGEAVFSVEARLPLERYPYIRLDAAGSNPSLRYFLFWRTQEQPGQQFYAPLEAAGNGVSWHRMSTSELWRGTTTHLALGAFSADAAAPVALRELALHPDSRTANLGTAWSHWHAGGSWPAFAINRYLGAPPGSDHSPARLIGLWAALALAFVTLWAVWRRPGSRALLAAGLLAVFLPWLLLDRLWQAQLDRQSLLTGEVFAGKTQAEKHAASRHAELYDYAKHIQGRLNSQDARVFLLNTAAGHNFDRLRLQFHMLPANTYNYGADLLPPGQMRRGDYVLTLGAMPQIQYVPQQKILSDGHHAYRARLVDSHARGNLYLLSGYLGVPTTP